MATCSWERCPCPTSRPCYYRLQHVTTCRQPFAGWQGIEPPGTQDRSAEQREVDRHLQEQAREGARR
jgi:hypothetical protein